MGRSCSQEVVGLGPLEPEVMGVLWRRGPSLAAEVRQALNRRREEQLAHTTVVNVLANLERKHVVNHVVEGKAYRFTETLDQDGLRSRQVKRQARELFRQFDDAASYWARWPFTPTDHVQPVTCREPIADDEEVVADHEAVVVADAVRRCAPSR